MKGSVRLMADESSTGDLGEGTEARYANFFNVGHNAFEVIFEFGQFYEGEGQARLQTRIVTSPTYAKRLLVLLQDSLEEYEKSFGVIPSGKPHE
jgi:hypothetical protein